MIKDWCKNSSYIAISSLLLLNSLPTYNNLHCNGITILNKVETKIYNNIPALIPLKTQSWIDEAKSLFPNARSFTAEEAKLYEESLYNLFTESTGKNFFDYLS